jgi:hypothetical protein
LTAAEFVKGLADFFNFMKILLLYWNPETLRAFQKASNWSIGFRKETEK